MPAGTDRGTRGPDPDGPPGEACARRARLPGPCAVQPVRQGAVRLSHSPCRLVSAPHEEFHDWFGVWFIATFV